MKASCNITRWSLLRSMLFASVIFTLIPGTAVAGRLTIEGKSEFTLSTEGEQIKVNGFYETQNRGDEAAYQVYPHLTLGDWQWAGNPQMLNMASTYRWSIEGELSLERLKCGADNRCAGLDLPLAGRHPVFIYRHYKDANGYAFSAPEVTAAIVGTLSPEERARVQQQAVMPRLEMRGDGQEFTGTLMLRNTGSAPLDVAVSFFASREFSVETEPTRVTLAGGKGAEIPVAAKNFSVLSGSVYPIYAIVQWQEGSVRQSAAVGALVQVAERPRDVVYATALVIIVIVSATALLLILRRKA